MKANARPITRRTVVSGVGAALFGLTAGCSNSDSKGSARNSVSSAADQTREIADANGTVKVPAHPKRVVGMDNAAGVIYDLGVTMVARNNYLPPWKEDVKAFASLPEVDNADSIAEPEKILPLKPDLMVTTEYQVSGVKSVLDKIMPVVVFKDDDPSDWKKFALEVGEAVNVDAQGRIDEVDARSKAVGKAKKLEKKKFGIVRAYGNGQFRCMGAGTFGGQILRVAGAEVLTLDNNDYATISIERLGEVQTEYIVLWTDMAGVSKENIEKKLQEVKTSKLWAGLPAVKAGRVIECGEHWIGVDFQAAGLVLDDLEHKIA